MTLFFGCMILISWTIKFVVLSMGGALIDLNSGGLKLLVLGFLINY